MLLSYNNSKKINIKTDSLLPGISRIAEVLAGDLESVFDIKPEIDKGVPEDIRENALNIVCGIYDDSLFLREKLGLSKASAFGREDCCEQYIYLFEDNNIYICGSDKRGLIYGMLSFSELCGVSPLVYWGDIAPVKKTVLSIDEDDLAPLRLKSAGSFWLSPKPSVKYRGFFINDEWPAFGGWCNARFGGFTAGVYEQVFMLLLRLKGNYMWPAMWSSTFSEDGPGIASAALADELGVIMGASHHEPMCRAGAEWQHIYGQYGQDNTWSFVSNRKAITEFWKDGINRNKNFENIITIGMRGENDSKLMGENATIADNIAVVKDAILTQFELMRENINPDLTKIPRMLAIYKEVEDYYYGAPGVEGLKDWDQLKDVIFMLCEDNFGNLRGLPTAEDLASHKGGYGMYYHYDYHGAPISYEWVNCVNLYKTREQMRTAYEYGIRDLWIVNVGDLKGYEYPLGYFMQLAYCYEPGMDGNPVEDFEADFFDRSFGDSVGSVIKEDMLRYVQGFTRWNSIRRPEHMNPSVYHPVNYAEGEKVYKACQELFELGELLEEKLPEDVRRAFNSMFYFAGQASLNLIMMNIAAGRNKYFAERGCLKANSLASEVNKRIDADKKYVSDFNSFLDGKWIHMMDSAHTCFVNWNDEGWAYPVPVTLDKGLDDCPAEENPVSDIAAIECDEYSSLVSVDEVDGPCWMLMPGLGRLGCGLKAYPINRSFEDELGSIYAEYDFDAETDGSYSIELTMLARNPVVKGGPLRMGISVNEDAPKLINLVGSDYYTEWMNADWSHGVMSGVRTITYTAPMNKGSNIIRLYPCDPNVIFERMVIHRADYKLPESYLGTRFQ